MDLGIALEGFFFEKVNGSTGQTSLFRRRQHQAETTPLQKAHGVFCRSRRLLPSKRHTAFKNLIPSTGIFTSIDKKDFVARLLKIISSCKNHFSFFISQM